MCPSRHLADSVFTKCCQKVQWPAALLACFPCALTVFCVNVQDFPLMVSVGFFISWTYQAHFYWSVMKINGSYYRNTTVEHLLSAIRSISGPFFTFQQDNAPAHRARKAIALQLAETPDFIGPQYTGSRTAQISIWLTIRDLGHFATASTRFVTSTIWKNDRFMNGAALISVSLTEQSASGDSICVTVYAKKADTLNIDFNIVFVTLHEHKLLLSSCRVRRLCDFVYSLISDNCL